MGIVSDAEDTFYTLFLMVPLLMQLNTFGHKYNIQSKSTQCITYDFDPIFDSRLINFLYFIFNNTFGLCNLSIIFCKR